MSELYELDPGRDMYEDFGFNGFYNDCEMFLSTYIEIKQLESRITKLEKVIEKYEECVNHYASSDCGMSGQSIVKDGIKARQTKIEIEKIMEGDDGQQ